MSTNGNRHVVATGSNVVHISPYTSSEPDQFEKGICQDVLTESDWVETTAAVTCFLCLGLEHIASVNYALVESSSRDLQESIDDDIRRAMELRLFKKGL